MSTINAHTLMDTTYSGDAPLAVAHGSTTLAAAQIGDKVRLSRVFAGTKVYAAKLVNAALGSGVKLDLGFEYANGEPGNAKAFLADADCAQAGAAESKAAPVMLAHDAYIVATVTGAVANGKIDSVVTFEFKGQ